MHGDNDDIQILIHYLMTNSIGKTEKSPHLLFCFGRPTGYDSKKF